MQASRLLVQCLENEGVQYVFGVPGEETLNIVEALSSSSIRFITTRHEQGAAFMADAYGRLTGKAGVCLATLGPGATNLVTGIADATMDRSPLVALTGQAGLKRAHKESHQYIDVVQMFRAITKWTTKIEGPSIIPEVVRKAFKLAQAEKPGACHIEVPEDIAGESVEGSPLPSIRTRRPSPDRESLQSAARLIEEAQNVIILAGNGVIRGNANQALLHFSQKTGIAVAHTFMGKGSVPWYYELSLLSIGLQSQDMVSCGFDRADLILSVGYDLAEYDPSFWNPRGEKRIVHIDFTPGEIDEYYKTTVEIVADIRETLERLGRMVRKKKNTRYPKVLRQYLVTEYEENAKDQSFPVKPQKAIYDIRRVLDKKDLLVSDVGAHKIWIARMYPVHEPNTCLISNGFAAMGFALPAAIAAKLVHPEQRVLAVCGDGGFMMNCQELETACRLRTPFVSVIFNDGGYGLIGWKQKRRNTQPFGIEFTNPDFVKFAESFGAKGYRIEKANDFLPVLKEAFEQPVPAVIDCPIDYTENLRLTEKLGNLICPI